MTNQTVAQEISSANRAKIELFITQAEGINNFTQAGLSYKELALLIFMQAKLVKLDATGWIAEYFGEEVEASVLNAVEKLDEIVEVDPK